MRISIFGFGDFGPLIARHLSKRAEILVYDRRSLKTTAIREAGAQPVSLEESAGAEVVILAVNLDALEDTLQNIVPYLQPGSLVVDVTSVKLKPIELMKRYVPDSCDILATHPLFGPVTAKQTMAGHKIVIDPIRVRNLPEIEAFLRSFDLEIIRMSADEHDREMAWVHALTFFVGRGLLNIDPPESALSTNYYNELMDVVNVERTQTYELFNTIQRGNPYAEGMRRKLLNSLQDLEARIQNENL